LYPQKNTADKQRYLSGYKYAYAKSLSRVTVSFTITLSDEVLFVLPPLAARIMISNKIIPPTTHTIGFEYHILSVVVADVLVVVVVVDAESWAVLINTISIEKNVRTNLLALS
jgi:hypothetical protein